MKSLTLWLQKVYGRIIHSEICHEFGMTIGKVECPHCQEEIVVGVIGSPICRCGLEWSLETFAVGTPTANRK